MNDTRSMTRARRISARIAVVLCLLLAVGAPLAASAAVAPKTICDVEAMYVNSATIHMSTAGVATTDFKLDEGAWTTGTSVTTTKYGAHTLVFKSTEGTGTVANEVAAPFFVDDSVLPTVESDAVSSYVTNATIKLTATDNFNGSGVDFLCYRVDGGKIKTAIAPAAARATNLMLAKIASIAVPNIVTAAAVDPGSIPPHEDRGECSTCHEVIIPTPEPTGTPDPTGTPAPSGGVVSTVVVTGLGSHTIEYWAQDVARNETAHVTKTFTIGAAVVVKTPTSLTMSISKNHAHLREGYVLSGAISPAFAGAPIVITYRRPGSLVWRTWTTVRTNSAGKFSVGTRAYRLGVYTYRVTFPGDATHKVARYVYDSIHIVR